MLLSRSLQHFLFHFQLYDKINTQTATPVRPPPSDAVYKTGEVSGDLKTAYPVCPSPHDAVHQTREVSHSECSPLLYNILNILKKKVCECK